MSNSETEFYYAPLRGTVIATGDTHFYVQRTGDKAIYAVPLNGIKNSPSDMFLPAEMVCTPEMVTPEMKARMNQQAAPAETVEAEVVE